MPRIAYYPGSFDPVTNGHLDVVRQAVGLCDRLIVAIGINPGKKPLFSVEERLAMIKDVFGPVGAKAGCAIEAATYDNLTVTAAQKAGATIMIRGLRDGTDLDYEMQIAGMNQAWRRTFRPYSCRPRPASARSPPHWYARSLRWAAMSRRSCRPPSPPASKPSSPNSLRKNCIRFCEYAAHPERLSQSTIGVRMIRVLAILAALVLAAPALAQKLPANLDKNTAIVIDTTKGRIVIELRTDLAPNHAARLKQLARDGFYNDVPFHRVIDDFMAQTGDGQNGNGTGGSKYPNLKAEFSSEPFKRGTVGMARGRSNDSANSQLFICFGDASFLNGKYTVIGEVLAGMDVVDKIKKGEPPPNPDKMVKVQVAADVK